MEGAARLAAPRLPRLFGPHSAQGTAQGLRSQAAEQLRRPHPGANERTLSVSGMTVTPVPAFLDRASASDSDGPCRLVAVQAHGAAALPAGALHGLSFCCLTFELTRPEWTDALPDGPTMTTGQAGKAAGRGGSRVERGVRPQTDGMNLHLQFSF